MLGTRAGSKMGAEGLWAEEVETEANLIYCVGETRLWGDVSVFPSSRRNWYDDERWWSSPETLAATTTETRRRNKSLIEIDVGRKSIACAVHYVPWGTQYSLNWIHLCDEHLRNERDNLRCHQKLLKAVSDFESLFSWAINTCQVLLRNLTISSIDTWKFRILSSDPRDCRRNIWLIKAPCSKAFHQCIKFLEHDKLACTSKHRVYV